MRTPTRLLAVTLALALLSSPSLAKIQVEFDVTVYFGRFRTYGWLEGTPAKNPDSEAAIHLAVAREMAARGLTSSAEEPDLIVVTHATLGGPWALDPENFAYGGYPDKRSISANPRPAEAVLLIDILEASSQRLIWRGIVVDSMPRDPGKLGSKIDKVVRKLFKKFPER